MASCVIFVEAEVPFHPIMSLVTKPKTQTLLTSKPTVGHDHEPVLSKYNFS